MRSIRTTLNFAALAVCVAFFGCTGELTDNAAPVELVVTNAQNLQQIELNPVIAANDADCQQNVGTVTLRTVAKRTLPTNSSAAQVRVTRYRVSYQRTDGGRLVPSPFVRSIDVLVGVGQQAGLGDFLILQSDALSQAPFASLLPQNGGRDPDTGRPVITMEVILEVFGETLGGDNVYDATRFALDFCYTCPNGSGCA